jgi:hypothetical protein
MILRRKSYSSLCGLTILFLMAFTGFAQTPQNKSTQTPQNNKPKTGEVTKAVMNPASVYKEICGQCHMAYPPEFLPTGSWIKIVDSDKDHYGNPLDLDRKSKDILVQYLKENGAENWEGGTIAKILGSLEEDKTPLRLTEVPYIKKKHRKISADILQRKSIGSLSKCNACHISAEEGKFSKKVVIPK